MATFAIGGRLRRSVAAVATAALGLAAFVAPTTAQAQAAAGPGSAAQHPASALGRSGFAMADPAPPPALPAPLDSSGPAQVQALEQQYQTDAQNDQQKYDQLAAEKGTLEQRAGDVQNRESSLETQATNLEDQSNALNSQAETLNSEIDAHNAEPHTFELPDEEAEYAAYNEEKANLDEQKANLQNQIDALTAQSKKLQSDQAQADADQTQLETDVQTHNDAVSALEGDVGKLEAERQQILTQIDSLLQDYAGAEPGGEGAPLAAEGGDESEPAAAAAPSPGARALPSGGGDQSAPPRSTYAPVQNAPSGSGSGQAQAQAAPAPAPTQTPVTVTLAPSTVSGLPASEAENLQPSETFDGLIPEANGDYAAEEIQPPAGESVPPAQKAFDNVVNKGGKASTRIGGRPATIDKIVPEAAAPAENQGGDTPRPAKAAAPPARSSWVPAVNQPNPANGPPVSIDALKSLLDQQGLGSDADQFDLEYSPTVLGQDGEPAYAVAPTDAAGNPELGAEGKPILRFSNLGLQNPEVAQDAFENEGLDVEPAQDDSPCPHSFSGATRVLMADGSTKAIAEVGVGDLVENAEPGGRAEVHRVDQVHTTTTDAAFVDVVVASAAPGGGGTLTGTANHPYYDATAGGFVDAGALRAGDRLQSAGGGQATVSGVHARFGPLVTYDLTIDGLHTYFVVAGSAPVLVHNCDGDLLDIAKDSATRASGYQKLAGSDWEVKNKTTSVIRARFPSGDPKNPWVYKNVVSSSGSGLSPAQISAIEANGDVAVTDNLEGFTHAEYNGLRYIDSMGGQPIAGGASRSVCTTICGPFIRGTDGNISGPVYQLEHGTKIRTFYWPGSTPG
ncbi:Hedgehog/intein hint domain protein [Catenulispora acidiphila DSM 44928]|uniref:Hedgehog/intein hint domain protein n=1 Tax=Catenulispora acidiphila (strain DSM 44928 / JCM 14897 / NBRC 102108 / NRRL B-24433 / ID139908) TaxID=479433 RepID=C7QJN3_CATAD|nr:polymorphic toxin-type HINT domain-containing protein [Catenulispora acidiphila]ACU71256.1 Hedgehog/intein hint domain protein [Catenulispora acidiphila DSM 44928]